MPKSLRQLYVLILNNEVIAYETNLSAFHKILQSIEPNVNGYRYYKNNLKIGEVLSYTNTITKTTYYIQKLK